MNKNEAFMYKVIFGLSVLFGGTLAWGIKEHNEKKRQAKYAREIKEMYDFESGMMEGCIKILGDIANNAVMSSKAKIEEEVVDADQSE